MKPRWNSIACLLVLAAAIAGCDPIGRGVVEEQVPDEQLRKTQHPAAPLYWFPRALGPAASGDFHSVAIADFDGDKLPDIAAGGFDRRGVRIWHANGDGTWTSVDGPEHLGLPTAVAVGDIDHDKDRRPDLIITGKGELPGVRVWLNRTDEEKWLEGEHATITQSYTAVKLADIDKDGWLDIVASREKNGGSGGIGVWINRGGKGWSADIGPKADRTYNDVAVADLNKDGHLDLVAARWGAPGGLDIWYGNSRGGWTRAHEDPAFKMNYQGVDTGDFNGDGEVDIVATSYRSQMGVCIFLNDRHVNDLRPKDREAGWWTTPIQLAGTGSFWDAKAADFNGDGLLDVAVASFDGRGVRLWLQLPRDKDGDVPEFQEQSWQLPPKGIYYGVGAADFNTDGKPELIAVSRDEGVKVWFQVDKANAPVTASPHARTVAAHRAFPSSGSESEKPPEDPRENRAFLTTVIPTGANDKDGRPVLRTFTEYRIGPGDELKIEIYPGPHSDPKVLTREVEPSGELLIPLVSSDPIPVYDAKGGGLSTTQLRKRIRDTLKKKVFKEPSVAITVLRHVARTVKILGEIRIKVNQALTGPGQYSLTGKTRVIEFIARHGGFTDRADLTKVELRRPGGEKRVLNLFKAVFQSKLAEDPVLDDQDLVTIPSRAMSERKIYLLGEVTKPGIYELRDRVTLIEGIQLADSFTRAANRKQVIVIRGDRHKPELFEINMLDILKQGDLSKNILLEDGDIVFVPRNWITNVREFYGWFLPGYDEIRGNGGTR